MALYDPWTGKSVDRTSDFLPSPNGQHCDDCGAECINLVEPIGRGLEARDLPKGTEGRRTPAADRFNEVGYNSASRNGEPMITVIRRKGFLPNPAIRFCTIEAKIRVMRDFMKAQGYKRWMNAVGLRADEMRRISKGQQRNEEGKDPFTTCWPLLRAGVTRRNVWQWWMGDNADPKRLTSPLPQGFDLGLYPYEGNCDDCFLKGLPILVHQERERPGTADWWSNVENDPALIGNTRKPEMARFNADFSYAEVKRQAEASDLLIPLDWRNLEFDAECGVGGTDTHIRCGAKAA